MLKRSLTIISLVFAMASLGVAQNTNSSTRTRTVAPTPSPTPAKQTTKPGDTETAPAAGPQTQRPKTTQTRVIKAPSGSVMAAFDKIIEGIQEANVDMVTSGYWNSSSLVLYNYNGSVTKGWAQMRKNRETSYPDIKDVKLDVRDKHVMMLGRDGAVVSCLWTQSQMFKGAPDTASGRMTLVFKRVGTEWKAVHLHTSNDKPDARCIPASEQMPSPAVKP